MKLRNGLAKIELVVVVSIIAVLTSLGLMAVLQTRETARKLTCSQNLRENGLAMQNYVTANKHFPAGNGDGFSFLVRLLPFSGNEQRYNKIDFDNFYEEQLNEPWARTPQIYICPSDPATTSKNNLHNCNYLGVSGGGITEEENGLIVSSTIPGKLATIGTSAVSDGLSNTLVMTEAGTYFEYGDGTRSPTRTNATFATQRRFSLPDDLSIYAEECFAMTDPVICPFGLGTCWIEESIGVTRFNCIFPKQPRNCANETSLVGGLFAPSSPHVAGVYVALADGSTRLISQDIDSSIWQALGSRNGGEVVATLP